MLVLSSLGRGIAAALVAVTLTLGSSGCSAGSDPVPEQLDVAGLADLGFAPLGEPASGCFGFPCTKPLTELVYVAPATASVEGACHWIVDSSVTLGVPVGYANEGGTAGPWPGDQSVVLDFCIAGLGTPLSDSTGTTFYQGTMIFDGGAADGVGKAYILNRDLDGSFRLQLDFSRDFDRIGVFVGDTTPEHLTQEQVDAN